MDEIEGTSALNSLTTENFETAFCQATVFTPDDELSSARLLRDLLPSLTEQFDADPTILPVQDPPLPREIPKVILQSKSGIWRYEFSSARANLFWKKPIEATDEMTLDDFFMQASKLLCDYVERMEPRIGRLAGIIKRYADHPEPGLFLSRHFCKDRWYETPLNRPENFELHAHKRFKLGDQFDVNSWVRNKTGKATSANESMSIVLLEQDINTLSEEAPNQNFSKEDIASFCNLIPSEFDSILKLYYPEESQ